MATVPNTSSQYNFERRLTSNRTIVFAFMSILVVIFVGFLGYSLLHPSFQRFLISGVFFFCLVIYIFSLIATGRKNLRFATTLTIVATDITVISAALLWVASLGNDISGSSLNPISYAQFVSLCVPIVLAGVLSDIWLVVVTTFIMNVAAIACILLINVPQFTVLFFVLILGQQWAIATITVTVARVYQRTLAELAMAYTQAQQLDVLKDQFIANVNHELRTPFMVVQGYIEVLQSRHTELTDDQIAVALSAARESGRTLLDLLNHILEVRYIDQESAHIQLTNVPVLTTVQNALRLVDPRESNNEQRHIAIQVPDHLEVWGDPVRFQQIITNLLSNALKYSDPETSIELTAHLVQDITAPKKKRFRKQQAQTRWMVEVIVQDYGAGIPTDQKDLLFRRFVRLPRDLASTIVGNGLGLYLCRVFAESMGGRIWAESTGVPGEGSSFHLVLPSTPVKNSIDMEQTDPRLKSVGVRRV